MNDLKSRPSCLRAVLITAGALVVFLVVGVVVLRLIAGRPPPGDRVELEEVGSDTDFDAPGVFDSGDLDGDGDADTVVFTQGGLPLDDVEGSTGDVYVALSDGTTRFGEQERVQDWFAPFAHQQPSVGDVNGDGLADLIAVDLGEGSVSVGLSGASQGALTTTVQDWFGGGFGAGAEEALAGEFSGDGLTDLAVLGPQGDAGRSLSLGVSTGSGFAFDEQASTVPVAPAYSSGDVDGDGTDEILAIDTAAGNVDVVVPKDGSTRRWSDGGFAVDSEALLLGDFDGDGRDDLAAVVAEDPQAPSLVLASAGDGSFSDPEHLTELPEADRYVSGDVDGDGVDDVLAVNRADGRVTATFPSTRTTGTWYEEGFVSAPATVPGEVVVYSAIETQSPGAGGEDIWLTSFDDPAPEVLIADEPSGRDELNFVWPRISPDRTHLLYHSLPDGHTDTHADRRGLWIADATGEHRTRILEVNDADPSSGITFTALSHAEWSPDGDQVVFFASQSTDTTAYDLYILNVFTGEIRRLTNWSDHGGLAADPSWAPDGSAIAFIGYDGTDEDCDTPLKCLDLYVIDPGVENDEPVGTAATRLSDDPQFRSDPYFSPDGRSLAWIEYDEGPLLLPFGSWIATQSFDPDEVSLTGAVEDIEYGRFLSVPRWSEDGQRIFTVGKATLSPFALVVATIESGEVNPIAGLPHHEVFQLDV
ncbi:MAG: Protein TolB [Acidimicrobiales bacterium]|nr:MAG: hypothetical protein EDR02_10630 [Actinomycetota bacterium]MBV6507767.1 Protein TolB [Acidimicrobiales bacterium]RIK05925.1 MAG: hypothetical protein DCC48_08170 [Acidobacteriota bacterium]